MDVHLCIQPDRLEVIVSDEGVGIRPNVPEPDVEVQGLGLSLIQALTDRVEFLGGMGEGTKVRMSFAFDGGSEGLSDGDHGDRPEAPPPPGELSITVSSGPLAAPVLGRVIAMLAARAEFSLEGISEAELVTDAVAAHAPRAIVGDRIQLGIDRPERAAGRPRRAARGRRGDAGHPGLGAGGSAAGARAAHGGSPGGELRRPGAALPRSWRSLRASGVRRSPRPGRPRSPSADRAG